MPDHKYAAKELAFKVSATEFVVDCKETGFGCGQQTVQQMALRISKTNLEQLKKDLQAALVKLDKVKVEEKATRRTKPAKK